MGFLKYLWVSVLSAVLSAVVLVPAFVIQTRSTAIVETVAFVSTANFFAIGTFGWATAWFVRRIGVFSNLPVIVVGTIASAIGWSAFGEMLTMFDETTNGVLKWWTVFGAASGAVAGYFLSRFGFPDFIHKEQFLEERDGESAKYWAFLSYSREDDATAVRIWKQLDRYWVPKELVGQKGRFGPLPSRLYPIFRDREELSSGRNLSAILKTALQNSEHLVVLLSPASAKSSWVNEEIEAFIASKGSKRVLPVILDGEPNPEKPDVNCLPPALVGQNILAADFRSLEKPNGAIIGDGFKLGIVKLVAGLLGIEFEQLQRREAVRETKQQAKVMTVLALSTSAAILSAVLFAVAANFFIWTQNIIEAEIASEADKLIEIHKQQGIAGLENELQFSKSEGVFCRALIGADGVLKHGTFQETAAKEIASVEGDSNFSIRYVETHEYGGSPFPLRIDGIARRLGQDDIILVALCKYDPPYFYGSFRSLFDPRKIDTIIHVFR